MLNEGKFLFKYRNFLYSGEKDHTRILSDNELFFPSPSKLNDPFDSNLRFRYDDFTPDEFIKYWVARLKENQQLSEADATKKVNEYYDKYSTPEGRKEIMKLHEDMMHELRTNRIGIFSMSGNCNSVVSWAHYSNSHEGFCVGFIKEKLLELIKREESLDFDEVKYAVEYPIINVYRTDEHQKLTKLFWWKSSEWTYENEYRIVWYDGANKRWPIDSGIIGVVILGCRIYAQNKNTIMTILKHRSDAIPLYQAKIKKDSFGLEFEKMQ